RYVNEIRNILDNPPAANLYQHLKTELTRRLSLSEDQKATRNSTIFVLRTLWLQRLPPDVQVILQAQPTLPLDQLAEIADRVIEVSVPPPSPTVQAVGAPLDTTELEHRIDNITRQLSCIQRRLDQSPPTRPSRPLAALRSSKKKTCYPGTRCTGTLVYRRCQGN
ncbi:hypothetical protein HPB47_018732, partial [Ixodes persulcatus]